MGRIGFRLTTANAPLCDRLAPEFGLVLQSPSQYAASLREEAKRFFKMDGEVSIEAVIAGSPAMQAGVAPDDVVVAIGTVEPAFVDPVQSGSTNALAAFARHVADLGAATPLAIRGRRNGRDYVVQVTPLRACRTRFEVDFDQGFGARADGDIVQVGNRFFNEYTEDQAAAVVAHELAHNLLRHRARLAAQGIASGDAADGSRETAYVRQTELEADILSVALLANAGYDPRAALRFWQSFGPRKASGWFQNRSHPAWRDRVATIAREIAALGPTRPIRPVILFARDRPLDGNWRTLVARPGST